MDLNTQIACFLKVAEYQSFSIAAEKLHITPTAVSKQIKLFERQIGEEPLFVRTTRYVALSEFGALLYQRCHALQTQWNSVNEFILSRKRVPSGKLCVLVSTIIGTELIVPRLKAFHELYPEITLELLFSEQGSDLKQAHIDVMVGFPQMLHITDSLRYRKVGTIKNILCASPRYLEQHGCPQHPDDLLGARFISHTLRAPHHFLPLQDGRMVTIPSPIMVMNNFQALNQACIAGIGLFLTGNRLVQRYLESGGLVQLLPQIEFQDHDIYLFYRYYDYELSKIRVFIDFFSSDDPQ